MGLLNRKAILGADDLQTVKVTVPEWGGNDVWVRTMTAAERSDYELSLLDVSGAKPQRRLELMKCKLLVRCLCDESGKRLFKDGDAAALGAKSAKAVDRLTDVAGDLNRVSEADIEELAKN